MTFLKIDLENKCAETDSHFFFLNGPLSQWFPCEFRCQFDRSDDVLIFNCAEQYMMAAKAYLFGDDGALKAIMAVAQDRDWRNAPKQQKAIGRTIKGFEEATWNAQAQDIIFRGNLAKFAQNADLASYLHATEDKIIAEGAHYDRIWGVGLAWDDVRIIDPQNWGGTNWLGQALMAVRAALRQECLRA